LKSVRSWLETDKCEEAGAVARRFLLRSGEYNFATIYNRARGVFEEAG